METACHGRDGLSSAQLYTATVPKSWDDAVGAHRSATRDAALDAAGVLIAERGLAAVTMSQVAERAGIGRATLYKHFADVDAVVTAWHHRQIAEHLAELSMARDRPGTPAQRVEAVLRTWAVIARQSRDHHGSELAALLHRDPRVEQAQHQLRDLVRDVIAEAVAAGELRRDVPADQLAAFALHSLTAAADLAPAEAVDRLVALTLDGMRAS
jgi:AcrR family transcriptional regulator